MKDDTNVTSYTGILGTNMENVLNFYTRFPNAKQTIQNMLNINKKRKGTRPLNKGNSRYEKRERVKTFINI